MSGTAEGGKKARREHAREVARREREAHERRRRRNRLLIQGGSILAVLAVVAVVAVVIATSTTTSTTNPGNMASDGILFTGDGSTITPAATPALPAGSDPVPTDPAVHAGAVAIVTYIDYACPYCAQFETTNAAQLADWVTQGVATLEVHPISILDRMSLGTEYATRAANAAACVASNEPGSFLDVSAALFANQPAEQTSGLDTAALQMVVADAGADSDEIASCIDDTTYAEWVAAATDRVSNGELASTTVTEFTGTPLVLVNGQQYGGAVDDAEAFQAFVASAATAG